MTERDKMHPKCCQNGCRKFSDGVDDGKTVYGSSYCCHFIPAKRINRNEIDHIWFRGCCAYEPVDSKGLKKNVA